VAAPMVQADGHTDGHYDANRHYATVSTPKMVEMHAVHVHILKLNYTNGVYLTLICSIAVTVWVALVCVCDSVSTLAIM
jgi:hypothetical protein